MKDVKKWKGVFMPDSTFRKILDWFDIGSSYKAIVYELNKPHHTYRFYSHDDLNSFIDYCSNQGGVYTETITETTKRVHVFIVMR